MEDNSNSSSPFLVSDAEASDYKTPMRKINSGNTTVRSKNLVIESFITENFRFTGYRWIALSFIGLSWFGRYYWQFLTIAAGSEIKSEMLHDLSHEDVLFYQLNSSYSYPSMIVPIFSGIWIDKFGVIKTIKAYMVIMIVGQWIFTLSGFHFWDD